MEQLHIQKAMSTLHLQLPINSFRDMRRTLSTFWPLKKSSKAQAHHSCPIQTFILETSLRTQRTHKK